jgi:hypothetical protein
MKRTIKIVILVVMALVLWFVVGPVLLAVPITLLYGWLPALFRLLRAWRFGPSAALLYGLTAAIVLFGTHYFLRWLYAGSGESQKTQALRWPWKWTVCGFGILFCTLLAVSSGILTTHQLYWISKSADPLVADEITAGSRCFTVASGLQARAEDAQWDGARVRASFEAFHLSSILGSDKGGPALEKVQPIWVGQADSRLRAIVLIPRRPLVRRRARIAVIEPGRTLTFKGLDELPQVLDSFGIGHAGEREPFK